MFFEPGTVSIAIDMVERQLLYFVKKVVQCFSISSISCGSSFRVYHSLLRSSRSLYLSISITWYAARLASTCHLYPTVYSFESSVQPGMSRSRTRRQSKYHRAPLNEFSLPALPVRHRRRCSEANYQAPESLRSPNNGKLRCALAIRRPAAQSFRSFARFGSGSCSSRSLAKHLSESLTSPGDGVSPVLLPWWPPPP